MEGGGGSHHENRDGLHEARGEGKHKDNRWDNLLLSHYNSRTGEERVPPPNPFPGAVN